MKVDNIDKSRLITCPIEVSSNLRSKILIIKSKYNELLTDSITNGIVNELTLLNVDIDQVGLENIPGGAFEIPLAAKRLINLIKPDIAVVVACIIKGDTSHYEFLSSTAINAIRNVSFETDTPIINGIITTETIEQAISRAGNEHNKGKDFANTIIDLIKYYHTKKT